MVRTFAKFRPFTIELEDGSRRSFDSLLFPNIAEMAKYATLSETGPPNDGRFEVITLPHTAKWRVLRVAFRAATHGLGPQPTVEHYVFTTQNRSPCSSTANCSRSTPAHRYASTSLPPPWPPSADHHQHPMPQGATAAGRP